MKDEISPRYEGRDQTLSANAARVSSLVEMAADDMALTNGEKVPLSDAQKVRTYGEKYLRECATNAVLPTVRGCAAKLGVTRQALYFFAGKHPNSEFAHWLEDFSDLCGELTMQAAMEGSVAAIPAIFVAKSRYQWREAPAQIEFGRMDREPDVDEDELRKRIIENVIYVDE